MDIRHIDGVNFGSVDSISVGGSPFTWANPEACRVRVFIVGGTLNTIQLSPDSGATWANVGLACGQYDLNPGWQIKVTYLLIPGSMSYTPF